MSIMINTILWKHTIIQRVRDMHLNKVKFIIAMKEISVKTVYF